MEIYIENQLKNIGYSIILGLIFGVFYDIISIMHIIVGVVSDSGDKAVRRDFAARIIFLLTDLLFMLGVTGMMSLFLYEFANGDLRGYLLAGAAAGFAIYRLTFGRIVSSISETAVRFIRRITRILIIIPARWVLGLLFCAGKWFWRRTAGVLIGILNDQRRIAYLHRAEKRLAQEIRME